MEDAWTPQVSFLTLALQHPSCLPPTTWELVLTRRTILCLYGFNQGWRGRINHFKQSRDSLHLLKSPKYNVKKINKCMAYSISQPIQNIFPMLKTRWESHLLKLEKEGECRIHIVNPLWVCQCISSELRPIYKSPQETKMSPKSFQIKMWCEEKSHN